MGPLRPGMGFSTPDMVSFTSMPYTGRPKPANGLFSLNVSNKRTQRFTILTGNGPHDKRRDEISPPAPLSMAASLE